MQWFIDIILELVAQVGYLTTGFVDRGDPATPDKQVGDWIKDGTYHDYDISSIVPVGTKGIAYRIIAQTTTISKSVFIRTKGNSNLSNLTQIITQVANVSIGQDGIVPVGTNRIIQYKLTPATWTFLSFTIKGWWL